LEGHDEQVVFAAVLGGIWPFSNFMKDLTMGSPTTLVEFMDFVKSHMNAKDTL
jgi:hypothetical protein